VWATADLNYTHVTSLLKRGSRGLASPKSKVQSRGLVVGGVGRVRRGWGTRIVGRALGQRTGLSPVPGAQLWSPGSHS
jgi:hypothetical protein